VVINNRDVRGAFTKEGWAFMQAAFKNRGKNYGGEEWVLLSSRYKSAAAIPDNLDQLLRDRYVSDYIKIWRDYYGITQVLGYGSPSDAAGKLMIHSGASVPVLALIGLGSYHTNVEPAADPYADKVIKAFKWAHIVVPPSKDLVIVAGNNQPYKGGLSNLQISVEAASKKNPPDQADAQSTQMRAQDALGQARQVMAFPGPDLEGKLDQTIARIMEAPIKSVDGLFSPAKMLNAAGAALCNQFNVIQRKFPFEPTAKPEVSLAELNDLLRPQSGRFWQFYEQTLKPFLQKQGNDFVPSGGGVTLNPAFLRFFTQVARFSDAMYRGGQDPQLGYNMQFTEAYKTIDKVQAKAGNITIDSKVANIGAPPIGFVWNGANSHSVSVSVDGTTVFTETGMWTIFRFFAEAGVTPQGAGYLIVNPLSFGRNKFADAKFFVNLNGAPAVFDKSFMSGLRCISTVATK
jgi:type VI secretion system protein ImpL